MNAKWEAITNEQDEAFTTETRGKQPKTILRQSKMPPCDQRP